MASVFSTSTLFEKQRVGRASGFKSQEKRGIAFPAELLWTSSMSSGDQSSCKKQTSSFLSLLMNQLPWGFAQTHSSLDCSKDREGVREGRFINTQSVPLQHSQCFVCGHLFYFRDDLIYVRGFNFIYLATNDSHIWSSLNSRAVYPTAQVMLSLHVSTFPNPTHDSHFQTSLLSAVPYLNPWHHHPTSFVPPSFPNLSPAS